MNNERLTSTRDLLPSEQRFATALTQLVFGRFEFLRIEVGELVLDPWPKTVRSVKFGCEDPAMSAPLREEFLLKRQVIQLFEYVRAVDSGEIRSLEVRHGLPFSMEVERDQAREEKVNG